MSGLVLTLPIAAGKVEAWRRFCQEFKLANGANVQAVYGQAVIHGDNVVIPAAEILSVAGFGMGAGGQQQAEPGSDGGYGSGGGGWVISRPVGLTSSPKAASE
jgi:uncharacterized spore protein YtfJ